MYGKVSEGDRQIYFDGRYEYSSTEGKMDEISDWKNENMGV